MNKNEIKIFEIIKSQSPLTKYFNLMNTEEIKPSYKWYSSTPGSQVYSPYIWSDFFKVLLNENRTPAAIEKSLNEQSNLFEFISNGKKTGNKGWYASTLTRLFYIPDVKYRKFSSSISIKEINEHINIVCKEWQSYPDTDKKLLLLIEEWFNNYQLLDKEREYSWEDISEYEVFVKEKIDNDKIKQLFSRGNDLIKDSSAKKEYNGPKSIKTGINESILEKNKQIRDIGKNIVENILNKKYGSNFVTRINNYDLCDFIVNANNKKIYIEVKSSVNNKDFLISRSELEFVKDEGSEYHIYFIYNININKNGLGEFLVPEIKPIFDFNYKFDLENQPYNKDGLFHLMPIKFKGKIPN